jgi:type I restriction enzyme S subunit
MNLAPLVDVADIFMGQSPSGSTYNSDGNGLPFFQGKTDFGDIYPTVRMYCTEPKRIAEVNDILISVRAPVGPTNLAPIKSAIGRGLAAIRCKETTDVKYLLYYLRYNEPRLAQLGKGSTFEAIGRDELEDIRVPLPPLPEQQRIAAILDRADRLRRTRRYAAQLSETFLQAVFVRMFGDAVTRFQKWDVVEVQEVGESLDSKRIPVEASIRATKRGQYPYYGASGIIDYVDEYIFDEETLLVAEDGANLLARSTPIAFIASGKYWVNNHAHVLTMKDRCHILYLCELLNYTDLKPLVTGTAQPKLTAAKLAEMRIPLPPLVLQEKFARIVQQFERLRAQQREAERQAGHLFQALLQRAFGSRNLRN